MAGLTKDAVVQLILQYIGGSKVQGAGPRLVAGAQEVIVKASGLSALTGALQQFGSTVDEIRSSILANPQIASIQKAAGLVSGAVSKINSLNIPSAQKDQLLAAVSTVSDSLDKFQAHTDILSGTYVTNPFTGIEAGLVNIDANALSSTDIAVTQELLRIKTQESLHDGGSPLLDITRTKADASQAAYVTAAQEIARIKLAELSHIGGSPVRTVLRDEQTARVQGDAALASTLSVLGAINANGSAFVINTSTAYVNANTSFAQKFSSFDAAIGNVSSSVTAFNDARVTADQALATTIGTLGSVNANNSAFIINIDTAFVNANTSLAQQFSSTSASIANVSAKVSTFADARVVSGKPFTQAVLSLDSNGYIGGLTLTNTGSMANIVFTVDNFTVVRPGTVAPFAPGDKLFEIGSNGLVKMHNVEVDAIKAGTVTGVELNTGSIGQACAAYDDTVIAVSSTSAWTTIMSTTITSSGGKPMKLSFSCFVQAALNSTSYKFRITRNGVIIYGSTNGKLLLATTTSATISINSFDTSTAGVASLYAVQIQKESSTDIVNFDARIFMVEEQIRINYQSFAVTAANTAASPLSNIVAPPIVLQTLTLSPLTISESAAVGTIVGSISGQTSGSTLTLTNNSTGHFAISGNAITVASALSYAAQSTHTISVTETLAGATGSPKATSFTISVTAAPANPPSGPTLGALALSKYSVREQLAAGTLVGNLSGMTSGSTLSIFAGPGEVSCPFNITGTTTLSVNTTAILYYADQTSYSIVVRETNGTVVRNNSFTINITQAPSVYDPNGRTLSNHL
jgi:hypothetical protein